MRSVDGDCLLIYLSKPATVAVCLNAISAGDTVRATWIDPETGNRSNAGQFSHTVTPSFSTPKDWSDALLLIQAERSAG